jgi:hypothetical protein
MPPERAALWFTPCPLQILRLLLSKRDSQAAGSDDRIAIDFNAFRDCQRFLQQDIDNPT